MPIIAIPALALVVAALMAILIIYGGKALGQLVANLVPDWHIPGFGSLRATVQAGIDWAINSMTNAMDAALGPVVSVLLAPVNVLDSLYVKLLAVNIATYQAIDRLQHVRIPALIDGVKYWATVQWALLYQYATALAEMIRAEYRRGDAEVRAWATVAWTQLYQYATALAEMIRAEYQAADAALHAWALTAWAQLYQFTVGAISMLRAEQAAATAALRSTINAVYADTLGRIAKATADAEAYALAAAGAAAAHSVTVLEHDAAAAVSGVWGDVTGAVTAVEGAIATDFPDILADLRAIPRDVPGSLAGDLALAGALAVPMLRYLERCGIPNCRNLGRLGHDFQELLDMVEGAGLVGFLVGLATDPHGAAQEASDILGPVASGVQRGARDLFGVR